MNTQITVHPKLQHYGLTAANLDAMTDWYGKVLGMTVNHRAAVPPEAQDRAPFSAFAFLSNDQLDHRLVLFEVRGAFVDPDRRHHTGLQHVAFECATLDDLLGTYVRLKNLDVLPQSAADHGVGISLYYVDPEQNRVEINASNYSDAWTATEHLRVSRGMTMAHVDPEKMVAARKAGASPWELHERAVAGEFSPAKPHDPSARP